LTLDTAGNNVCMQG